MNTEPTLAPPQRRPAEMSDLGVFLYLGFGFLLVGTFSQFFHVGVLDAMHQLDVLLQHQPLGERPPGVRAVSASTRLRGELWLPRGAHCRGTWPTAGAGSPEGQKGKLTLGPQREPAVLL